MKRSFMLLLLTCVLTCTVTGQTAPDAAELTKLLRDFLAATNNPETHERFWAEDLIYTRSAGRRVSKAEVLKDVRSAPGPKPGDPQTVFTAEDVRIQQYGNTAVVAFQLVGTTNSEDGPQVAKFLNSGTFVKRNGKWQVVNWQATRMARSEADSKREIEATVSAFFNAMLNVDAKKLTAIADPSFIWTHTEGRQMKRQEMISELVEGRLKYLKLENSKVTINVYGETAIVRGESLRQRSSIPETPGTGDATPFTAFYTITFVNQGGPWRAVAMHTSRARNGGN
jgi:ketosteroid isomerase-like protein